MSARMVSWRCVERWRRLRSPANLRNYQRRVYSQNGEDGVLEEIFRRVGTTNRSFVEFGVQDGSECNCRYLVENCGWSGLWIEASDTLAVRARERFGNLPVRVRSEFVTAENIVALLREEGMAAEPDLLSIDLDGNDYWVWQAMAGACSARVVVIEYNAGVLPGIDWVMPYRAGHVWDGSSYYGASLDALERLGTRLGYALVGCDGAGVNAFFVRRDVLSEAFPDAGRGSRYHYVSPKFSDEHFGHPPPLSG